MTILYAAYLLAYTLGTNQFSVAGNTPTAKGVEVRILEALGPHGTTLAECEAYANAQRKRAAITYKLPSYQIIKYQCTPIVLSAK